MTRTFVAGAERDIVWSETRNDDGMHEAQVGVWRNPDGTYTAYARDGWGAGIKSSPHPDETAARTDTTRLWHRHHGG